MKKLICFAISGPINDYLCVYCHLNPLAVNSLEAAKIKPKPDCPSADYGILKAGASLSLVEVTDLHARLVINPGELEARLKLLGYYHFQTKNSDGALPHLLWLIENRPTDSVCYQIHLSANYTSEQFAKCREHWLEQVRLNPGDDRVHGNAAAMVLPRDSELGVELFHRAQTLNPRESVWPRRLARRYKALALSVEDESRKKYADLALQEAEKALSLRDSIGEWVGLLIEVIPIAIERLQLNKARKWSIRLLDYGRNHAQPGWEQSACIYLSRVGIAENKAKLSRLWLSKALESIKNDPDYYRRDNRLLVLLDELLQSGEISMVIGALELSANRSSVADRTQIRNWLKQIKNGDRPRLRF